MSQTSGTVIRKTISGSRTATCTSPDPETGFWQVVVPRWSAISGNMSTYGSGIAPMTRELAREMLEQEGMTSAIEKHFATEIQDA
jgi:hypothetical protein